MKKIILAISVITLGLGFLLSGCGGTWGNSKEKVQDESGPYAINIPAPAVNPLFQFCSATSKSVHLLNSYVTVEAMINTNGGFGAVFERGYAVGGLGSGIVLGVAPDGTAHFEAPDWGAPTGGAGGAGSTTVVNDGLWHHLAGVLVYHPLIGHPTTPTCDAGAKGSTHVDIYVDGNWENCAAGALPSSIDDCFNDVTLVWEDCSNNIGRDLSAVVGALLFNGTIDEVRLWKAARTPNQIQKWMDTEIRGSDWDTADPAMATITGYWRFNQGTGPTATDSSGYGNNCAMFQCVGGTCGGQDEEFGPWYGAWVPGYQFPY